MTAARRTRRHGTRYCYVQGCRRPECVEAERAYGRNYWRTYVRPLVHRREVPVDRALEHVRRLRAAGMGNRSIALAAGVGHHVIYTLDRPERRSVRVETERAILAVTFDPGLRPAVGLQRRVRALSRLGWTGAQIAAAGGMDPRQVSYLLQCRTTDATRKTVRQVMKAYDALSMRPGPSRISERRAAAKGWPPPLAWDDDTIDDPTASPSTGRSTAPRQHDVDSAVVARVLAGHPEETTTAEREQIVPALAARGLPDPKIAELCLTTDRTIFRTRERLGVGSRWAA